MKKNLEIKRKIIHIFFGFPILLYKFLPFEYILAIAVIAVIHNLLIAPLYMRSVFKDNKKIDFGIVMYPIAVLIIILVFKNNPIFASFLWITLSFGDGFSGLIGVMFGKTKLYYNRAKTIEGFIGGFLFSIIGMILSYFVLRNDFPVKLDLAEIFILIFVLSLTASFAETLPFKINDNIVVPIAGFITVFIFVNSESLVFSSNINKYYLFYIVSLFIFATLAYLLNFLNFSGATAAFIIGLLIMILAGINFLLILIMFFIISIMATKFRFQYKKGLGLLDEKDGIRGLSSVLPKGLIPLYVSLLIGFNRGNSLFKAMFIAVVGAALFDTVSSEIGKGFKGKTFSLLKFKIVPSGEKGGISFSGTLWGILSLLFLYLIAYSLNILDNRYLLIMIFAPIVSNILEPYFYLILEGEHKTTKPIVNSLNLLTTALLMVLFTYL